MRCLRRRSLLGLLGLFSFSLAPCFRVALTTEGRLRREAPPRAGPACYVPTYRGLVLLQEGQPVLLSEHRGDFSCWLGTCEEGPLSELGRGRGWWISDFSSEPKAPELAPGSWSKLRQTQALDDLPNDLAALLAMAAGLSEWHFSVRFCSACGAATEPCRHGQQRRCAACAARFRPRLDPAVLVLVTRNQELLLGRKARWPLGRFSALAGFVEFGETLEECVVREVMEEAGVQVDARSIRFVGSQPWLFPRSLLLGFTAEAKNTQITVDTEEMEDVRWFQASYVAEHLQGTASDNFNIPSQTSLANALIKDWLKQNGWQ